MITPHTTLPHSSAKKSHGWANVIYMTTKKPTKKTVAKKTAKKAVAKKAPAKKAAPKKKAFNVSSSTETNIIKSDENNSSAVIYVSEITNPKLRDKVLNWFRR